MDDLLHWVAEGSNIHGLIVYGVGMALILGTLNLSQLRRPLAG
jgi:hypothetical protein